MAIDPCQYVGDVAPEIGNLELCAWTCLTEGAQVAASRFRLGTFCSTDDQGYPSGRVMTLRHVDGALRRVTAYADLRTPKVVDIRHDARTAWVFYDPERGIQVQISGRTRVLAAGDDATDPVRAAWDRLSIAERRCYLSPVPTSTVPVDLDPDPEPGQDPLSYTRVGTEAGLARFGLLVMQVSSLEILLLGVLENTQARMLYAPDGAVRREWVTR